ncbi:OLC1v1027860C1 [Oldenlandia corymbosa var. corymbosa]|uniref:OLC1v1027860C1 n=1 Tax=Oldenlandia corymbosa var. corymbosa TaxID=529605 RepID=A0AAV1CAE5_OLDCO|nr:OLC1v1027860C1 [Oldenlandia corymbosa var. corymbosa]
MVKRKSSQSSTMDLKGRDHDLIMYPALTTLWGKASPRPNVKKFCHQGYVTEQHLTNFLCFCTRLAVLPDDLVFEILRRMTSRCLLECKLVCKSWQVMIESPQFMESRSLPGLIVYYEEPDSAYPELWFSKRELNLFHCSLRAEGGPVQEFEILGKVAPSVWFKRSHLMTQIIDGLVCVYGLKVLKIWNVHTGESMSLPEPSLPFDSDNQRCLFRRRFYLGYDPSAGVYKLLKLDIPRYSCPHGVSAEILTLGNSSSSWRELQRGDVAGTDWPPAMVNLEPYFIASNSNSSDGFIYWVGVTDHGSPRLLSFDLRQENFRWITLPDDLIIRDDETSKLKFRDLKITQSMGYLALWFPPGAAEDDCFVLFISENKGISWSKHAVRLPRGLRDEPFQKFVKVVGNLPTGELLLLNPKAETSAVPVYSYDHIEKKFGKFVVGKMPQPLRPILGEFRGRTVKIPVMISCGLENFKPLDVALSRGG